MKLIIILTIGVCLSAAAKGYSQRITLSERNASLESVFKKIESQSGYNIVYREEWIDKSKKVDVQISNGTVDQALNMCFKGLPLTYSIVSTTVVIKLIETNKNQKKTESIVSENAVNVKGIVTDESGKPLRSVSAVIPGTPLGSITNERGEYSITGAPENAELRFSYVGYVTQIVPINGRTTINIALELEVKKLDETIIIGYGTTTKRTSTASIASITGEEIRKQPVSNPLNALQGRVAGALITQSNGLPGSRVTIQIRGINSIDQTGAGTQPLYIVDGVPFNITDASVPANNDLNARGQSAAAGGLSPFNLINPADIERIDVLKDADATAIYGTRGANGVVLITTRKGKAGKTKLDVNVYQGQGKVGHFIPMMNTQQYLQMRKEAYANDGITSNSTNAPDLFLWDQNAYTDWQQKYLGGTATMTDAQATVSGGDQRTRFLLNTGYHKETPVFPGDYKDQRISTRLNVDHNSADRKFNANLSVNYAFNNSNLLVRDLSTLYNLPPNLPLYNADGSLYWNSNFTNPESYLLVNYFGKTNNLMANTILKYTLLPGLDLKTNFGFNHVELDQNTQNPALSKNPLTSTPTNSASFANIDQKSYIFEPQATYNRNLFGGKLSALFGGTFQNSVNNNRLISANNYSTPALLGSALAAGTVTILTEGYTQYRYNSIFGRITYDWKTKYLLNAVLRRDGSSRFGPGKQFANFWDVGAGWVFSEEAFAKSIKFLSFGKLRGSYGVTGNDQIQDYVYRPFFNASGTYQNNSALAPNRVENPGLHWQTTYKLEFGLDLAFLNRRLELTANYYRNRTPDQLGSLALSSQAGFNSYTSNFDAHIQNTGFEFELNTININKKNFKWNTSFNLTIPRTNLLSASPSYFFYNQSVIGQPLSVAFRYSYQGVDPATGKPLYKNVTKDSLTFTPNFSVDRSVIGYTAPKFYGGLNNVLNYKNLELSFFFQFQSQEGNIYPTPPTFDFTPGVLSNGNQPTFLLNRWTKAGEINGLPRYSTTSSVYSAWGSSDAIWGNSSFVRLRTINISYSLPAGIMSRLKVDNLRFYIQGQNLWWSSKNKYVYDPETGTSMPPLRVITAGINVTL